MSVGRRSGGLPPDELVEAEAAILADSERLISAWHDPARHAMQRIVLAPCSPFSVSRELMRDWRCSPASAACRCTPTWPRTTTTSPTAREVRHDAGRVRAGRRLGRPDVWHAHCVKLDEDGIRLFGRTRTGVAHCPCSNMRLASGIAPIGAMRRAGVKVGLGVDGSASNDGAHLLGEARQALLLARVGFGPAAMTAREALEIATLGGAQSAGARRHRRPRPRHVGRRGRLRPAWPRPRRRGPRPVAALVFCQPATVALSIINGRVRVRGGQFVDLELAPLLAHHRRLAKQLYEAARHPHVG